jgi:ABC-type transport system involved in multi-copper enzyme maturation permease subunit
MSAFLLLWREALLDALRRKLVLAIAAASLLSLMVLDDCAGCAPAIQVNGQTQDLASAAPALGIALMTLVGLWVVTLAGLLASDHLAQSLEDGHAAASLARPVRRETFAFARLAGSLTVSLTAGALLLGTTAFWVTTRDGLPAAPALLACLSCALACVTIASFAMTASLALPRIAIWLLVFGLVFFTTLAAGAALFSREPNALTASPSLFTLLFALLDRFGPPIASGMLRALAPWLPTAPLPGDLAAALARGALWAGLGLGSLALAFRRIELK